MKAPKTIHSPRFLMAACSAAILLGSRAPLLAQATTDAQVAKELAATVPHGAASVIAHIDGDLTPEREAALKGLHVDITCRLSFIHSVSLTLPARSLGRLAALPFVTHLSHDGGVKKLDEFTDASSGAFAARQQYGLTGQGVTVAVVDSGVSGNNVDLWKHGRNPGTVIGSVDFTKAGGVLGDDLCGHGTHVGGIIAGDGTASTGPACTHTYYGVAPNASLLGVRVLDQNGQSDVTTVLAGIQWIIQNRTAYNVRVINLSLGHPVGESYRTDPLCQAVEAAWKAGIVVVCAAGNDGRTHTTQSGTDNEGWGTAYGSIQSPANDPSVITVGATKSMDGNRNDDRIATYSSRGPSRLDLVLKPDLVAPGNKIVSLDVDYGTFNGLYGADMVPYTAFTTGDLSLYKTSTGQTNTNDNRNGAGMSSTYFSLSGTSMAAPVVCGAAALMLQKDPTLTPDVIKARLMVSADKWTFPVGTFEAESPANTFAGVARVGADSACSGGAKAFFVGNGGTLQFNQINTPSAGTYMMAVAYLNADCTPRTGYLSVNGAAATRISFPPSGSSGQTATIQVPVTLQMGANTLKFSNPTGWTGDIDKITLALADPLTFGAGYLNIPAALASTVTVTQPALSPALKLDASGNVSIDTTVIASKAISGVTTIWGSKAISGVTTIWGSKAISGVSTVSSSKAISGSSVWSDKAICGSSSPAVDLSSVAGYGD